MTEPIEQTDAVVIGAGVIGCAIAWRLGQAGKRVVVVERGRVGGEASHAAGGMLAPLVEAEREDEFFNLTTASLAIYPDFARELKAGCALKLEPLLNQTLRFALKFPGDHQVDNRRLMIALHGAARNAGVEFLTHTEARELLTENIAGRRRISGVVTARGEIHARTVVIAAGSWSSLLRCDEAQRFEVEPARGQMASIEMPAPAARHVIYSRRGYLVPRLGGYLIAGSTTERVGYDKRVT